MAKYSYEFKKMVVTEYINGEGGIKYLTKKVTAQQPPHQTQRKPSANAEGLFIHDSYSSVDDAGLVLVAMDSLISSLQGMKLSSSSFENGLPMYCISVRMRLR